MTAKADNALGTALAMITAWSHGTDAEELAALLEGQSAPLVATAAVSIAWTAISALAEVGEVDPNKVLQNLCAKVALRCVL